jgi:hypothetical protein
LLSIMTAATERSPAAMREARSAATATWRSGSFPLFAWLQSTMTNGGSAHAARDSTAARTAWAE